MSVTVRGERNPIRKVDKGTVHVPAHAVLEDREGRFVYLVKVTGDAQGVVERRAVKTGNLSNLGLEITSGLETGDKVVTAGMSKMLPGLEVRLTTENTD
jgi:multidrug efflux pump subunit AcrA (membrane-fusion protein)